MDVPRNSAASRSKRTHASSLSSSLLALSSPALLKDGDIHFPVHGRSGLAKDESLGTTKLLDRPKSTILNFRSDGLVPVRTTFYFKDKREGEIGFMRCEKVQRTKQVDMYHYRPRFWIKLSCIVVE